VLLVGALPAFADGATSAPAPASTNAATIVVTPAPIPEGDALQGYLTQLASDVSVAGFVRNGDHCVLTLVTSTARLASFLLKLDATDRPIRQEGMTILAPKPGVDNLRVEIRLTLNAPKQAGVPLLACLRDVTGLFPVQGNTIWATSFGIDDSHQDWEIDGQCTAQHFADDLCAAMAQKPQFQGPKVTVKLSEGAEGLFTFRLTFAYQPAEN
jgi:hypothetical protein